MDKLQAAEQTRRALQMFAQTLTDDEAMQISTLYPKYEVGKVYKVNELFIYGENAVGDPQLYRVVQEHTSQDDWKPDATASLYSPIGLTEKGYPVCHSQQVHMMHITQGILLTTMAHCISH